MATLEEQLAAMRQTAGGAKDLVTGTLYSAAATPFRYGAQGVDAARRGVASGLGLELNNPRAVTDVYDRSIYDPAMRKLSDGIWDTVQGTRSIAASALGAKPKSTNKTPGVNKPGQPRLPKTKPPIGKNGALPAAMSLDADIATLNAGGVPGSFVTGAPPQDKYDAMVADAMAAGVTSRRDANQASLDAFAAKPVTVDTAVRRTNVVPSSYATGAPGAGQPTASPSLSLPQVRAPGGAGGGQASFIADPGGKLTPGSRMFDPAAFKAQLAQDQVDAQRDVAGIQANAGLAEADLAGQYGVLGGQLAAQSDVAGGAMDHQRNIELEAIKAELAQESPLGQMQRATAMTQLQRQQMITQALESKQLTLQDLLTDQTPAGAEVVFNAAGIPIGYSRGAETIPYPDEIIQKFTRANAVAQGAK